MARAPDHANWSWACRATHATQFGSTCSTGGTTNTQATAALERVQRPQPSRPRAVRRARRLPYIDMAGECSGKPFTPATVSRPVGRLDLARDVVLNRCERLRLCRSNEDTNRYDSIGFRIKSRQDRQDWQEGRSTRHGKVPRVCRFGSLGVNRPCNDGPSWAQSRAARVRGEAYSASVEHTAPRQTCLAWY